MVEPDTAAQFRRAKRAYLPLQVALLGLVLGVFLEPTARRVSEGRWQRGHFLYAWTLSLDLHALIGFAFLLAVAGQVVLGYRQAAKPRLAPLHGRLGRVLGYGLIPLFLLVTAWTVWDRSLRIDPAAAVLFKHHRGMVLASLGLAVAFQAWFLWRALAAIRRGDVLGHVDALVGFFAMTGDVALIRFLYALFWFVHGSSPLSVTGMGMLAIAVVIAFLAASYAAAGRLRENALPLVVLGLAHVLLAVLGRNHFTLLDVSG